MIQLMKKVQRFCKERANVKKEQKRYTYWITQNEKVLNESDLIEKKNFAYHPKISILIPIYNVGLNELKACVDSVRSQWYENWELCLADDHSSDENLIQLLKQIETSDKRIKVCFRPQNGHISEATNTALQMATGEYIGLLDDDDMLSPDALFEVVRCLNQNPALDLIYSDEDKTDMSGKRCEPRFKPDWSPDLLMGTNYICHFGVYRKSIAERIGGFRKGFEGAQDYDFVLRFSEQVADNRIKHIPKILYHWRKTPSSTAESADAKDYAFEAGRLALEEALKRRGLEGEVNHGLLPGIYDINYAVDQKSKISLIITGDASKDRMRAFICELLSKTHYPDYEVIIDQNDLTKEDRLSLPNSDRFLFCDCDGKKDEISKKLFLSKQAKGDYFLFAENSIKILSSNWIKKMLSYARLSHIGAVGAKILTPKGKIAEAGIILGLNGLYDGAYRDKSKDDLGYFGQLTLNNNFSAVSGKFLMVKKEDYFEADGHDGSFVEELQDIDLCLKLLKNGKYNICLHDVEVQDDSSRYSMEENEVRTCDDERFLSKWNDILKNDPFYNPNFSREGESYRIC